MAETVKTRFAPSPTGYLHVGAARTALFAWLWARHNDGAFLLRIEDTDRARFVEDAEPQIIESLNWLGLDHDGEIIRQSERLEIYQKHALDLVKSGNAYIADDSPENIQKAKKAWDSQKLVGREIPRFASRENPVDSKQYDPSAGHVIRFRWPDEPKDMRVTYFDDPREPRVMNYSPKAVPSSFEDFVLIKSDGYPTYNFAHIIDDHTTGINCVIRGDEFISSLNKYVALYEALDWPLPKYYHVPTILGPDKAKLSKRHGAKDVLEYRADGFLPQALANFIALIGWSPGQDRELFFDLASLAEAFELKGLQKSPGVFDEQKLLWMNGEHMKNLDTAELLQTASRAGFWKLEDLDFDAKVVALAGERAKTLKDLAEAKHGFYYQRPKLTQKQLVGSETSESVGTWLERVQRELEGLPDEEWNADRLDAVLDDTRGDMDLHAKQLYPVLREALTGEPKTPALKDLLALFGKTESLARLEAAAALVS